MEISCRTGRYRSQYNLDVMYDYGKGVPQDNVYAYMWYNIAASSGGKEAVKQMTPSQLEKAQDIARECIRKKHKGC